MRKTLLCLSVLLLTALAGCVTINVYFPKAAAEKAADQFIGSVIGQDAPADSSSAQTPPTPTNQGAGATREDGDSHGKPLAQVLLDWVIPAAHAAQAPDLRVHTPAIDAIHQRMRQRYRQSLRKLLDSGVVGFTADGLVAVRNASGIPLAQRSTVNTVVADANRDREALYREIANANGHPEWESKIRSTFAALWIQKAHSGWYYRSSGGSWQRK